jgi:hypothetical protein
MIGLYPIGTPAIFYGLLFKNRDLLEEMQRTELLMYRTRDSIEVFEKVRAAGELTEPRVSQHARSR